VNTLSGHFVGNHIEKMVQKCSALVNQKHLVHEVACLHDRSSTIRVATFKAAQCQLFEAHDYLDEFRALLLLLSCCIPLLSSFLSTSYKLEGKK
jgi:hypothetical protein